MRILVVDDEAIIVKGIRFNLENDGYEVLTGSNGKDAVEIVRQNDVDDATDGWSGSLPDHSWIFRCADHYADGQGRRYGQADGI